MSTNTLATLLIFLFLVSVGASAYLGFGMAGGVFYFLALFVGWLFGMTMWDRL